ncbi:MAG: arginine deiminase [Gemmatimonadota bacterium]
MNRADTGLSVTSEVGRLRKVICHSPGLELTVVTPDNRVDYLFDDILDLEIARREHSRFTAILARFCEVMEISDLLTEVLALPEARSYVVKNSGDAIRERATDMSASDLARLFIEGEESRGGSLAELVNESGYALPPLPNMFFTRDSAAVVGDRVMIASMRHEVRWSEEVMSHALFAFHPALRNEGLLYDGSEERRLNVRLEGGDVHVLRRDLLAVGMSERTTAAGIDELAAALFRDGEVTDLLVVLMPPHRSSIHLDMIFTVLDRDLCCVFPPYFFGPTRLPVLHIRKDRAGVVESPDLFTALRDLSIPLQPVFCGGSKRTMQEREQWASGCNFVAVGPGQVLAYARNEHTLEALRREAGFRIVSGVDFLTGDDVPGEDERFVVTFEGSELVRGGGGPRCMTLPVEREPVI